MAADKKWRLRWAFFWKNGSYRYGIWDIQSPNVEEQWVSLSRDGLDRVEIHGKKMDTHEVFRLFICPSENFKAIKWVGACSIPAFGLKGAIKVPPRIYAIQMETIKDGSYQFSLNGKLRKELSDGDYNYNDI